MKNTKRNYTVSIKASKNFQSVSLTEGFEVDIDDSFNELEFNKQKEQLKTRLIRETKDFINDFVQERKVDDEINVDVKEDDEVDVDIAEDY